MIHQFANCEATKRISVTAVAAGLVASCTSTHMLTLMVELLTVNGILYSTSFWISARLLRQRKSSFRQREHFVEW